MNTKMKSIKYILTPVLAGIIFASCNSEVKGPSQADLDAQVDAKVKSEVERLKTECDNNLMNAAKLKADSIMAAASKKTPAKTQPVAKTPKVNPPKAVPPKQTPPPPPPPPKPTIGNGKPKMGSQNTSEVGNGKPKMGGTKNEQGKTDDTKIGNGKPKMGGGQ